MKVLLIGLLVISSAFAQENSFIITGADKVEKAITFIDNSWDGLRTEETTIGNLCTRNLLNYGPSREKLIVGKFLSGLSFKKIKETRTTITYSIQTHHSSNMEYGSELQCFVSKNSEVINKLESLKD